MSTEPPPPVPMLSPAQVAALLCVHPRTVSRWATNGKLRSIRTPGGQRRFLQSDVVELLSVDRNVASSALSSLSRVSAAREYDTVVEEAARAVTIVAAAVSAAGVLTAAAADLARRSRELAALRAEELVAAEAARSAVATRYRADAAAARVSAAAQRAADSQRRDERDPISPEARLRATRTAIAVQDAADGVAAETEALARTVSQAVLTAAQQIAATHLILERAIEAEVLNAAAALGKTTATTARAAATVVDIRLGRAIKASAS